jgi:transposase InsO family protein
MNRERFTSGFTKRWGCNVRVSSPVCRDWRGFVYVAFVIDVCARRIVGWRVASSLAAARRLSNIVVRSSDPRLALSAADRVGAYGR